MADELLAARSTLWHAPGAGAAVAGLAIRTSMRNQWPVRIEMLEGSGPTLHVALALGESAQQLKARITREYVNKLEAGRYDPTVGVLKRIAKALGVPVTELLK